MLIKNNVCVIQMMINNVFSNFVLFRCKKKNENPPKLSNIHKPRSLVPFSVHLIFPLSFFSVLQFPSLMSCINEWSMECEPFPLREFNKGMPNGRYIGSWLAQKWISATNLQKLAHAESQTELFLEPGICMDQP